MWNLSIVKIFLVFENKLFFTQDLGEKKKIIFLLCQDKHSLGISYPDQDIFIILLIFINISIFILFPDQDVFFTIFDLIQ